MENNPFSSTGSQKAHVESGFDVRRQELSPQVRSYVDTLYVQIRQIFDKYGVANIEDLRDGVKSKKIKMESKDGERLKQLTRWLRDTLKERNIPSDARPEDQGYVVLENVPDWVLLPSQADLKEDFRLDSVQRDQYRDGRPMYDFMLGMNHLLKSPYNIESDWLRGSIYGAIEKQRTEKDRPRLAKIFDLSDLIKRKKETDFMHRSYLWSSEVLRAIDDAGFRPATFEELLAYARDHWRPDLTDHFGAHILALGSLVKIRESLYRVPTLRVFDSERCLACDEVHDKWNTYQHILVIKK